jgi:DNA-binding transcriptional MerR regulator
MALTSPGEAAKQLGLSDAMLRQLAGPNYYGRWLEAESPGQGGRHGRMYTERDVLLLRYVIRTEKRGTSHKKIKADIEEYGLDAVLQSAVSAEEAVPVLADEVARLRLAAAKAQAETAAARREHQTLQAEMEQRVALMRAQIAATEAEADKVHTAFNEVRAGALLISQQVEVWQTRVEQNLKAIQGSRVRIRAERTKISDAVSASHSRLGSFKGWLLGRGDIREELREAQVRLEQLEAAEQDIEHVETMMFGILAELAGQLSTFKVKAIPPGRQTGAVREGEVAN